MEKNSTLLHKKPIQKLRPRRSVITNLLNYSKSLETVSDPRGLSFLYVNN